MRYQSLFGNNNKNINKINNNKAKVMDNNTTNELLEAVVLMLNQVLKEQSNLNEKFDSFVSSSNTDPIPENSNRRIILERDKNGRLTGASIVDNTIEENKEKETNSPAPNESTEKES